MVASDELLAVIVEVTNESFNASDVQSTISQSVIILDGLFLAVRLNLAFAWRGCIMCVRAAVFFPAGPLFAMLFNTVLLVHMVTVIQYVSERAAVAPFADSSPFPD